MRCPKCDYEFPGPAPFYLSTKNVKPLEPGEGGCPACGSLYIKFCPEMVDKPGPTEFIDWWICCGCGKASTDHKVWLKEFQGPGGGMSAKVVFEKKGE